ncbi:MAG: ROK family protein [Anaerolineales bacterium]|nr:ROK family protein [Anaerolineales bacterium]
MSLYGGIEAGGTKFVCAVGSDPDHVLDEIRFPTSRPEEALTQSIEFFRAHHAKTPLSGIGVAAFGPLDPNPASPTFGYITTTPKPHWAHTDVVGALKTALGLPVGFDTDVNGAALGEYRWGAAQGLNTFVYLTVGTGLGGGGMVGGRLIHGLVHPEMGHMRIPHDLNEDPYPGWCTYHGDCFEGLTCGPAIEARWSTSARDLPVNHPAWALEARYLALGLVNIITVLSPQRIVMGGGVMDQRQLFPMIRRNVTEILNGYIQTPALSNNIDEYIVPPGLGARAGVLGAIALAAAAAES